LWVLLACVTILGSCETVPAGPTLANVSFTPAVDTPSGWLVSQLPTVRNRAGTALDPTVCCCHVRGTITNRNSVPVHVRLRFAAMTAENTGVGAGPGETGPQILFFQPDLQPGESKQIEAPGFILPCASIHHVNYQMDVSSVGVPIL
jgi:hypothetical protein